MATLANCKIDLKRSFKTSCSVTPIKFRWTIERFTLISTATVKTPTFCALERRNRMGILNNVNRCAYMRRSNESGSQCIHVQILEVESKEVDTNEWVTVRIYDINNKIIRHGSQWKNMDFEFAFDIEGENEISLDCLPLDTLIIEWEMVRMKPKKHFLTQKV